MHNFSWCLWHLLVTKTFIYVLELSDASPAEPDLYICKVRVWHWKYKVGGYCTSIVPLRLIMFPPKLMFMWVWDWWTRCPLIPLCVRSEYKLCSQREGEHLMAIFLWKPPSTTLIFCELMMIRWYINNSISKRDWEQWNGLLY